MPTTFMSKQMPEEQLFTLFKSYAIEYQLHKHEPIATVAEGLHIAEKIPGAHSKNLFLRNKRKTYYCLVSIIESKLVDLKKLSQKLGHGGLSFGSPQSLLDKLNIKPGAVTPYALINNTEQDVQFFLDEDLLTATHVNFHPLRNDMTVTVPTEDFKKFFECVNVPFTRIKVPVRNYKCHTN